MSALLLNANTAGIEVSNFKWHAPYYRPMLKAGVRRGVISVVSCLINIQLQSQRSVLIEPYAKSFATASSLRVAWATCLNERMKVWRCKLLDYRINGKFCK